MRLFNDCRPASFLAMYSAIEKPIGGFIRRDSDHVARNGLAESSGWRAGDDPFISLGQVGDEVRRVEVVGAQ